MEKPNQKKYSFFSSLYWKIAAVFLFALIIISLVYLYIAAFTAEMYFQEASQRLNEEVAKHIAEENQFFVNGKANENTLKKIFHDIMVINPSIEVYLLDTNGKILSYFAPNKEVKLKTVPLEPIN
jgi:ABC-type multidrug transport system fused ATPase/permease subunit